MLEKSKKKLVEYGIPDWLEEAYVAKEKCARRDLKKRALSYMSTVRD